MEMVSYFLDFVLHIDVHLFELVEQYGLWVYAILFVIVFCETGLVVTPFLPGDSLLFASGVVAGAGLMGYGEIMLVLLAAGILGDAVNYCIGRHVGPAIFSRENRLIKKEHLLKAHQFYERHGGKAIVLARFVPIVRTFAPFVAGIALMHRLPSMSAANGRAAEQAAAAIHDAGFQYVLLNSEKALETGENGAARMLSALQSAGVTPLGLRSAAGSSTAKTISIRGISIAALAYTDTLSADSKKAVPDAAARERMVTVFDADQARQDIRAARESGADIVLVAMHWGGANDTAPTAAQRTAAQALCEAGADIIIGAHSNAVQPVEYLSSAQDTAHSTLVAWSMGTLLSASRANREVVSGMLLHLTLTYDMQRRALSIASVQYTPTYCWGQKTDALYKYRVLCSAEEAPNAMIQKQREIMGRALKLIQDTMAKGVAVQR